MSERLVRAFALALVSLLAPAAVAAQDHTQHQMPAQGDRTWTWQAEAKVFFGFNYQRREFTDFDTWESQNWLMASAERPIKRAHLRIASMLSFEPFTLQDIGSPQVFQTGETFNRAPLIDYQHPHDLLMALGAELRVPTGSVTTILGADLVGSPTLGPPAFMHRASADENPQAPLAHHHLDSTHITPGVLRAGIETRGFRVEGSVFQGREPDEDRIDVDLGALDSYAVRVGWTRGPWATQASAGWLNKPEATTPYDAKRLTASLSYVRGNDDRALAWTAAFGQNREIHGNLEAYLLEANWRRDPRNTLYGRIESVAKDILDAGFHPSNTFHPHRQSQVGALTVGYVRDILRAKFGGFGAGADITAYSVPGNLRESYGSPLSFHAFVRYRGRTPGAATHVH
jgi:hypothetical protein